MPTLFSPGRCRLGFRCFVCGSLRWRRIGLRVLGHLARGRGHTFLCSSVWVASQWLRRLWPFGKKRLHFPPSHFHPDIQATLEHNIKPPQASLSHPPYLPPKAHNATVPTPALVSIHGLYPNPARSYIRGSPKFPTFVVPRANLPQVSYIRGSHTCGGRHELKVVVCPIID